MALAKLTDAHPTFQRLFNAGDAFGLTALYEPTAKFILPEGEVTGHDAIRKAMERFIAAGGRMQIETTGVVENGDMGITTSSWRLVSPDGQIMTQAEGVEVFRRTKDGWLSTIDCPYGVG